MSILNQSSASAGRVEGLAPQNGKSYVQGTATPPLVHITIPQFLSKSVSRFGARDTAVFRQQNIRIVDKFPMTVTGKSQKFIMRDQKIELLSSCAVSATE